jgi:hypothetical protein
LLRFFNALLAAAALKGGVFSTIAKFFPKLFQCFRCVIGFCENSNSSFSNLFNDLAGVLTFDNRHTITTVPVKLVQAWPLISEQRAIGRVASNYLSFWPLTLQRNEAT